ncbi:sugar phosphate isomerase/epimerase family protein [Actinomadura atramentaria]|uniref:sugar phosphate isomerase/epimerase family protein n=1 Tax=Actinomadura atramentaria TaxID=1990 RepID=UPI000377CBC8|nr:sugar phosphate isomerase/epimerase family protein [Actinomadura atramentaria]
MPTPSADRAAAPRLAGIGDEAAPDLPGQLGALADLGWDLLELRSVDGTPLARLTDDAFRRAADRLGGAGVAVPAVASKIGDWSRPVTGDFDDDLAELDVLARRCAVLGTRIVRIMSYPSGGLPGGEWGRRVRTRVRELARRAADRGLVLAVENCAGWAGDRADRLLGLVAAVDSPALRLLFDTGNGVAHGYAALPMLRRVAPFVVHVHVKDARPGPDGGTVYVPPGEGVADVAGCLRLLAEHRYEGVLSLEPHVSLRPHLGDGRPDRAAFTEYGRALAALVAGAR